jgi:hypothetical protein
LGCAIDGETGQVDFYVDGKHVGVAMTGFGKSQTFAGDKFYYPKVEIGTDMSAMTNLTGPFEYVFFFPTSPGKSGINLNFWLVIYIFFSGRCPKLFCLPRRT